jgi:hypothetical protein
MKEGFYKIQDKETLYAPNYVYAPTYTLLKELKDTYTYPLDGWEWKSEGDFLSPFRPVAGSYEGQSVDKIRLFNFNSYNFDGGGGNVEWELFFNNEVVNAGQIEVDAETVANWGEDDEIMFDYVCDELNLVKTMTLLQMNAMNAAN